jgi:DNA-binding transcriptional regulator YiaG
MVKRTSKNLVAREAVGTLLKLANELVDTLKANDWPLGAKDRPFTWLGGEWTKLSAQEAEENPERVRKIEHDKEHEQYCLTWRQGVIALINDCKRYVDEHGGSEHMQRFDRNELWQVLHAEPPAREFYSTAQCVLDLQGMKHLVSTVGGVKHGNVRRTRKIVPRRSLTQARGNDTQQQAAVDIAQLRKGLFRQSSTKSRRGSTKDREELTQGEVSDWERGERRPQGLNLLAIKAYEKQRAKPSSE